MKLLLVAFVLLLPAPAVGQSAPAEQPALPDEPVARPLRFSLHSTSAFGVTHARFFNQLVGGRLDYRVTSRFAAGVELAYANLKGKEGRTNNVLPEASLEYRVPLSGEAFGLPLRMATGFLPKNGPTLRLSAGLDFAASDSLSFEVDALEPMVWITRERPEVSFNLGLLARVSF